MPERAPEWFGPTDVPWVDAAIEHAARFDGRRWGDWAREREAPLRLAAPARKRAVLLDALEEGWMTSEKSARPARLAVYDAAARARDAGTFDRARLIAPLRGVDLFADFPAERPVVFRRPAIPELLAAANLALAQRVLRSAVDVRVELSGNAHAVVRQIRLRRLMAVARPSATGTVLEITGVFSVIRRTTLYGRAFASLLPAVAGCDRWTVDATLQGGEVVRLQTGDPITGALPAFDSKLERAFARDVRAIGGWDLSREPEPVAVDGTLVFPDFAVWRDTAPDRRWLVEIVGFWTPEYLKSKLDRLGRAGRSDLVLCIDRRLGCGPDDVPAHLPVVWFDRTIDAAAVLARLAATPPVRLRLADYFLDFAGRRDDAIHARLTALAPGQPVRLAARDGLVVLTVEGGEVAALATHAARKWLPRLDEVREARVVEVVERTADQSLPPWRDRLVVPRWRVPIVELTLR